MHRQLVRGLARGGSEDDDEAGGTAPPGGGKKDQSASLLTQSKETPRVFEVRVKGAGALATYRFTVIKVTTRVSELEYRSIS